MSRFFKTCSFLMSHLLRGVLQIFIVLQSPLEKAVEKYIIVVYIGNALDRRLIRCPTNICLEKALLKK